MFYQRQGDLPQKPFTKHCTADGVELHEEMLTSSGFSGPSSLMYRLRPATAIDEITAYPHTPAQEWAEGALANRRLELKRVESNGDAVTGRTPLFFNEGFAFSFARVAGAEQIFYRNAWSDELLLVLSGHGTLASAFGGIDYGPLDLLYVPRGTVTRLDNLDGPQTFSVVESRSPLTPPPRMRGTGGQLSYLAMYQESDLRTPVFTEPVDDFTRQQVIVKLGDRYARHTIPSHPFDAVGWSGALYPFALNMEDLNPMASRLHTTPDLYQIFESKSLCVTAITPVRLPDHPQSTAAQPDHSADCDEIFHRLGRKAENGREEGMVTLHSRGNPHGASLSLKAREPREKTSGYGLILDVYEPVSVARSAISAEDTDYYRSWA